DGREALPAAGGGNAPDVRPERRGRPLHEKPREEDGRGRGRDAGIDRAPEAAAEGDVDPAPAQLGVEPADDEPLGTGELERDLGAAGHDPRPLDGNADLQPAALVRRTG